MDAKVFSRTATSLRTIKSLLAADNELGKLLILDNPVLGDSPPISQVRSTIFIQPIIDVETTPPFNRDVFITLTVPEIAKSGQTAASIIYRVSCFAERMKWTYGDDRLRLFEMVERVTEVLDNAVVANAQPLFFDSILETVINKQMLGYSILFRGGDGIGDPNDNK